MIKFKDFLRPLSTFQGKFYLQGIFKTVLYIQVLFKPVQTLLTLIVPLFASNLVFSVIKQLLNSLDNGFFKNSTSKM